MKHTWPKLTREQREAFRRGQAAGATFEEKRAAMEIDTTGQTMRDMKATGLRAMRRAARVQNERMIRAMEYAAANLPARRPSMVT